MKAAAVAAQGCFAEQRRQACVLGFSEEAATTGIAVQLGKYLPPLLNWPLKIHL